MSRPEILVYGRERFCPDVARTRNRLTDLKLEWTECDIEADDRAAAKVEELTGMRRVPTVVIGDAIIIEPSNEELDETLHGAGYNV